MTPLALRLRQLRMHMPAVLFVVEDYAAIKAPVSSGVAGLHNYCFPPRLRKPSSGLPSPVKTQVGPFILNANEWEYSPDGSPVGSRVASPWTSVRWYRAAAYVSFIAHHYQGTTVVQKSAFNCSH